MRRIVMLGIFVSLICCTAVRTSAEVFCWVMLPFSGDRLLVNATPTDLGFNLGFLWQGPGLYQILGGGKAARAFPFQPGEVYQLGLAGAQPTTDFFGGNQLCSLKGQVTVTGGDDNLHGTWTLVCNGSPATPTQPLKPTFTVSGTLAFDADCDGTLPADEALLAAREAPVNPAGENSNNETP